MEQDTTSLPQLPHELLIMIFEELAETPDMARLRLVSRKFESLAAPIFYRHMTLTPALIANFAPKVYYKPDWNRYKSPERRSKHLFSSEKLYKYSSHQEMMLHTKHLTIKKSLDWESVLDLVKILHNLRSVTWAYWDVNDSALTKYTTPMDSIRSQNRQVQFYVEAVDGTERRLVRRMLTLPPRLISFKVDKFELWTFSIIMGSLLSCPELRSLHLTGQYYSAAFLDIMLEEDDRLPPIQELVLRNYYWDHSRYTSINFWNWTKVTHLELQDVCVTRFLSTVTPEHLVQLRTFMLEPRCLDTKERKLASLMILNLLLKVHALEKLYLKCHLSVVFGGIIKHGSSLRSLELRDFRGPGSKEFCALSIDCVEAVGRSCPNLMELGMEVHFKANEGRANALHIVDTAITEMRNLRRLTLYTSTYQLNLPSAQNRDSFYHLDTAVRGWLHWFLGSKKGAEFEIIILKLRVEGGKATGDCIVPASVGMAWTYKNGKGIGLPAIDCRL